MTGRDPDISAIRPVTASDAGEEPGGLWQESRDLRAVLREQLAGLTAHWRRLSARYGELGAGHEQGGKTATAGLLSMGAVVYDTCAQDLTALMAALDRQFPGEDDPADSCSGREGAA